MKYRRLVLPALSGAAFIVLAALALQLVRESRSVGSAVAEPGSITAESLLHDQKDPDVRRWKASFRRDYRSGRKTQRDLYDEYVDRIGVNGIADILEESYCHSEGHDLGQIVFARLGDLEESVHLVGDRCTSGVFHGTLMAAFDTGYDHVSSLRISDEINRVCAGARIAATQRVGSCVHGIGHAVMSLSRYEIGPAQEACGRLDLRPLQYYCATGAFMEYMIEKGADDIQRSLHFPCDTIAEFYAACYRYKMGFTVERLQREGDPIEDIAQECVSLDRMPRLGCFHGLGFAFMERIAQAPSLISTICGYGDADDEHMCIEGAIEKLADLDEATALSVCAHLEGRSRSTCLGAATEKMYRLAKDFTLYFDDTEQANQ